MKKKKKKWMNEEKGAKSMNNTHSDIKDIKKLSSI